MGRAGRTVTISITPELAEQIDRLAGEEGRTRSEFFREAARQYLERRRRLDELFEYGAAFAKSRGLTEDDVLEAVMEDRRKQRAWDRGIPTKRSVS